jgi:hypothetical protein
MMELGVDHPLPARDSRKIHAATARSSDAPADFHRLLDAGFWDPIFDGLRTTAAYRRLIAGMALAPKL